MGSLVFNSGLLDGEGSEGGRSDGEGSEGGRSDVQVAE
jgi:hypothetical protein